MKFQFSFLVLSFANLHLHYAFAMDESVFSSSEFLINNAIESGIPGCGMAAVKNDDSITKGFGVRNKELNEPIDGNTRFFIGSVTKSFTSAFCAKVISEKLAHLGETAFDTPISKLIQTENLNVDFMLSDRMRFQISTLRDLLAHKTCLSEGATLCPIFDGYPNEDSKINKLEYLFRTRYIEEQCSIRSEFVYNNAMYEVAGHICAKIANPDSDFIIEANKFLTEIGMYNSMFLTKNINYESLENVSIGYVKIDNEVKPINSIHYSRVTEFMAAAGGLMSSLEDMAKYMKFQLNKGRVGDLQIVPEESMNWCYKISNFEENHFYALGFYIQDGLKFHGGHMPPFKCLLSLNHETKEGVFTFTNGDTKSELNYEMIHQMVYNELAGATTNKAIQNWKSFPENILKKKSTFVNRNALNQNKNPSASRNFKSEEFNGLYGNANEGTFILTYVNNEYGEYYFQYGKEGIGYFNEAGFPGTFIVIFDNTKGIMDYIFAATNGDLIYVYAQFESPQVIYINGVRFEKDANTFPSTPWAGDSCAPNMK